MSEVIVEVIHPYNEALKMIDQRIRELVNGHGNIVKTQIKASKFYSNGGVNMSNAESENWRTIVKMRLRRLEKAKQLLYEVGLYEEINISEQ